MIYPYFNIDTYKNFNLFKFAKLLLSITLILLFFRSLDKSMLYCQRYYIYYLMTNIIRTCNKNNNNNNSDNNNNDNSNDNNTFIY